MRRVGCAHGGLRPDMMPTVSTSQQQTVGPPPSDWSTDCRYAAPVLQLAASLGHFWFLRGHQAKRRRRLQTPSAYTLAHRRSSLGARKLARV